MNNFQKTILVVMDELEMLYKNKGYIHEEIYFDMVRTINEKPLLKSEIEFFEYLAIRYSAVRFTNRHGGVIGLEHDITEDGENYIMNKYDLNPDDYKNYNNGKYNGKWTK